MPLNHFNVVCADMEFINTRCVYFPCCRKLSFLSLDAIVMIWWFKWQTWWRSHGFCNIFTWFLRFNSMYPESEVRNPEDKQERTGVHITDR